MKRFVLLFSIIIGLGVSCFVMLQTETAGWDGGVLSLFLLFPLVVFIYRSRVRSIDPSFSAGLFYSAFVLKIAGSMARYWVAVGIYNSGDAIGYHEDALWLSGEFQKHGLSLLEGQTPLGTWGLKYLLGGMYQFIPLTIIASFFIFATLSFIGSVYFYRAFRLAYPQQSPVFYRVVIFFLPSILYWPSSLGKDALIFFASGIAAYGFCRFIQSSVLQGIGHLVFGVVIVALIRPHIGACMMMAMFLSYAICRWRGAFGIPKLLFLFVAAVLALRLGVTFLFKADMADVSTEGIVEFYDIMQQRNDTGGSSFVGPALFSVAGAVFLATTVLFRPFPWEAGNPQMFLASLEGLLWAGLIFLHRKTFFAKIRAWRQNPWTVFCLFYSVLLIVSFVAFSNFGIIARQRVQFTPFFWSLF